MIIRGSVLVAALLATAGAALALVRGAGAYTGMGGPEEETGASD